MNRASRRRFSTDGHPDKRRIGTKAVGGNSIIVSEADQITLIGEAHRILGRLGRRILFLS